MKCSLIKIEKLSGDKASIYSVYVDDDQETLFEKFIRENLISFKDETKDIIKRLKTMGHKTGAREQFFKLEEGIPGDGVCALYDDPDSKLRLYCIRYGTQIIVIGNGGPKSKNFRAFQEDEKLTKENYFLRWLSQQITNRIREGEISYSDDYMDFIGNLKFRKDDEE